MRKRRRFKKKSGFRKFLIAFLVIITLGGGGLVYELYSRVYVANIIFTNDLHSLSTFLIAKRNGVKFEEDS